MKPVKVPKGAYLTKVCYMCGQNKVTHRLTGDYTHKGYCLSCAVLEAKRRSAIETQDISEGEYQATRRY